MTHDTPACGLGKVEVYSGMETGNPEQFRWLKGIIAAVFVLNVVDGVLTISWYAAGRAEEANPLMAGAINTHPLLFMLIKLGLVALGSVILWRYRTRALAVVTIFLAFIVYYWILIFHLSVMSLDVVAGWLQ